MAKSGQAESLAQLAWVARSIGCGSGTMHRRSRPGLPAVFCSRACIEQVFTDTSAAVNPSQPSRPFLRLFSAMQPDSTADDAGGEDLRRSTDRSRRNAGGRDKLAALRQGQVEHQLDQIAGVVPPKRVEVSLAEIAPVLADAIAHQRGWLSDFANDTVSIDADLYEVLLAYQQMRRLNAA